MSPEMGSFRAYMLDFGGQCETQNTRFLSNGVPSDRDFFSKSWEIPIRSMWSPKIFGASYVLGTLPQYVPSATRFSKVCLFWKSHQICHRWAPTDPPSSKIFLWLYYPPILVCVKFWGVCWSMVGVIWAKRFFYRPNYLFFSVFEKPNYLFFSTPHI